MLDSQVAILENAIARFEVTGQVPSRIGNRHPSITPFSSVETADGHMIIAIGNDSLWEKFCHLVGRAELSQDERFVSNHLRTENWAALESILAGIFADKNVEEWTSLLQEAGVPCGPINTVDQVLADPQIMARNMIEEADHPIAGRLRMAGSPIKLSSSPEGVVLAPAPLLGQHTEAILKEYLSLSDAQVALLKTTGVV